MAVSPFLPLGFSPGINGVPRRSPSILTVRKRNGDGDEGKKTPEKKPQRGTPPPRQESPVLDEKPIYMFPRTHPARAGIYQSKYR